MRASSQRLKVTARHRFLAGLSLAAGMAVGALSVAAANPDSMSPTRPSRTAALALPFSFEANHGQAVDPFQFIAHGRGCTFLLAPDEAAVALVKPGGIEEAASLPQRRANAGVQLPSSVRWVRMRLAGANPNGKGTGREQLPGRVNYLLGDDPTGWRTGVPTFARVQFPEVYPGVDLIYYGRDRQLEYDFVVAPGADPSRIALEIGGADEVEVDTNGDLLLCVAGGQFRQHAPVAFQDIEGRRMAVESRYRLAAGNRIEFKLGAYDSDHALVIDPVFSYATYFGGAGGDVAWDVAVDAEGATFLAGETTSAQLLASSGAFQTNYAGGSTAGGDAFVAKLGPTGTNLIYLTYLGGVSHDGALGLAIDAAGSAYLTGFTGSTNFPTAGMLKTNISGVPDPAFNIPPLEGFVTKLSPDGTTLVYSAYLGGSGVDEGVGIAVDAVTGHAYVAGFTESTNLPVTQALQPAFGGLQDGFVAKLNPAGSAFEYLTYLGGTNVDYCSGIATDTSGQAYVTGLTRSTNFWMLNAVQPQINNPSNTVTTNINTLADAFVTKLTSTGELLYSSFLGGRSSDAGFRIAADATGHAYVVGLTESGDFPLTYTNVDGAVWTNRALADVFVTKVAPDGGTNWSYSVAFGGRSRDEGWDLALDPEGQVTVIGVTGSTNFPTRAVPWGGSKTNSGLYDVFIAGLTADGSALRYSFYYGGRLNDYGYGIKPDRAGNLHWVGSTSSTNLFVQSALQPVFGGGSGDAFVARLLQEPELSIAAYGERVQLQWRAPTPEFVLESKTGGAEAAWTAVAESPTTVNGYHTVTLGGPTNCAAYFRLRQP